MLLLTNVDYVIFMLHFKTVNFVPILHIVVHAKTQQFFIFHINLIILI